MRRLEFTGRVGQPWRWPEDVRTVTNSSVEKEVVAFVAEFTRYPVAKIMPNSTLFGDIGIDGDDGDEILSAFTERFQVDMSACRPVHFGGEGFVPWAPLLWIRQAWLARREKDSTPESRAGLIPITVQDLVDSARAHRWVLKYEEGANQLAEATPLARTEKRETRSQSCARRGAPHE